VVGSSCIFLRHRQNLSETSQDFHGRALHKLMAINLSGLIWEKLFEKKMCRVERKPRENLSGEGKLIEDTI